MNNEHKLTVISAPSGCGKDTVAGLVCERRPRTRISVSCTTRDPRPGETEGESYFFITREQFMDRVSKGRMLEYNEYVGNLYGTPRDELEAAFDRGETVLLVIDVNGGRNVKKIYPGAQLLFLLPPSMEELRNRIIKRNANSAADMDERLEVARKEMAEADNYDTVIVNDDLDACVEEVIASIDAWQEKAEKERSGARMPRVKENKMNKTTIGKLLEENESAYSLVLAVARRARDIAAETEKEGKKLDEKAVSLAIQEFGDHECSVNEQANKYSY